MEISMDKLFDLTGVVKHTVLWCLGGAPIHAVTDRECGTRLAGFTVGEVQLLPTTPLHRARWGVECVVRPTRAST
jgi:hypothetical protein